MARTVWKFHVPLDGEWHDVVVPSGGELVAAASQGMFGDRLFAWFIVDPSGPELVRRLRWVATGEPFPAGAAWRATVHTGSYVWHLVEHVGIEL